MNRISLKISNDIGEDKVSALRCIKTVAEELGIPFIVVGAFARDMFYNHIHQIPSPRRTLDIDLGVEVADWEEFESLTGTLAARECLLATSSPHRFVTKQHGVVIDIVPYGEIAGKAKTVSWPPEHDIIMSMVGFEEAYASALQVTVSDDPRLEILVPSAPALALLKLISWDDSYPRRERDAQDLLFMMESYEGTGIEDLIYDDHADLLEQEGYDPRLVSVRLLGRYIAELCSEDTLQVVTKILARETDEDGELRLLTHMVKGAPLGGTQFTNSLFLLQKLLQGVQEQLSA